MNYADFLQPQEIEKAIVKVLIGISSQSKLLAPVDTGLLRNSINWKTANQSGGLNDSATRGDVGGLGGQRAFTMIHELEAVTEPNTGVVGTAVEYAAAMEYGRQEVNIPAQPYLRPAANMVKNRIPKIMGAEIRAAIKRMGKKDRK